MCDPCPAGWRRARDQQPLSNAAGEGRREEGKGGGEASSVEGMVKPSRPALRRTACPRPHRAPE